MSGTKGRAISRKASMAQTSAMAETVSRLETDGNATAALGEQIGNDAAVYASVPDEEIDFSTKVDFTVLQNQLMEVNILDDDSVRQLPEEQLYQYIARLGQALCFYVSQYQAVAEQLGNAMELILNQRVERFGSTSQRSSSLLGKKGRNAGETAGRNADTKVPGNTGLSEEERK